MFIIPKSLTCFETSWSIGNEQIEKYSNIVKSFARDTPERSRYHFDYTITHFNGITLLRNMRLKCFNSNIIFYHFIINNL